jgi:DNA repair protein RadC
MMPSNRHDTTLALAALLGTPGQLDRASRLLTEAGTARGLLACARRRGPTSSLSAAEARTLRAAWGFIHGCIRPRRRGALLTPDAAVRLIPGLGPATDEAFWVISVDARLRPLSVRRVTSGASAGLVVSIPAALRVPVSVGATGLFLLHNHPSGTPWPSEEDVTLTRAFQHACEPLGLQLHDHVIVAGERWHSCASGQTGSSWLPASLDRAPRGRRGQASPSAASAALSERLGAAP